MADRRAELLAAATDYAEKAKALAAVTFLDGSPIQMPKLRASNAARRRLFDLIDRAPDALVEALGAAERV